MRLAAEYVLPLRWHDDRDLAEMTAYLTTLSTHIDVTVVDGSPPGAFAAHAREWGDVVRHLPPADDRGRNGKVRGILTGVDVSRHERLVLADDDVRHDRATLSAMIDGLRDADLVKPQNVFRPLPWHARWDTARSLLNRAAGSDYPGTYAVRRSLLVRTGGYDADVLFENLEMERTVRAAGGRVRTRHDLFVTRRPPTARQFRSQRIRQAYDSLAQPGRMATELAIAPVVFALRRRPGILAVLALLAVAAAERGRRRAGALTVYPTTSALWAPLWLAERAITSWLALAQRAHGGVPYAGTRIVRAATPARVLRRRFATMRHQNALGRRAPDGIR